MMTINDLREILDKGLIAPKVDDIVQEGDLITPDEKRIPYQLHQGWDPAKARLCDKSWGSFNIELVKFIKAQNYDANTLTQVLANIQIDDKHWDWLNKSLAFKSTEYNWFFLMSEGYPQGACLIYHPKKSALSSGDIFYVEYIAAAPWNRTNPMSSRSFKGVASTILDYAINYAEKTLKLRRGFSLHALPKAEGFYQTIGMIKVPAMEKDSLAYFEMPEEDNTVKMAGVENA